MVHKIVEQKAKYSQEQKSCSSCKIWMIVTAIFAIAFIVFLALFLIQDRDYYYINPNSSYGSTYVYDDCKPNLDQFGEIINYTCINSNRPMIID